MKNESSQNNKSRSAILTELMVGLVLSAMLLALTGDLWRAANCDLAAVTSYVEQSATSHRRNIRLATHLASFQRSESNNPKSAVARPQAAFVPTAVSGTMVCQTANPTSKTQ